MTYKITIPISKLPGVRWQRMLPVSQNEYQRMTWRKRKQVNDLWYDMIFVFANNRKIPLLQHPTIRVVIYFPTKRIRDWTNFAFKPIYDALTKANIIVDDNDRDVDIRRPDLKFDEVNPRTEIIIDNGTIL